MDLNEIGRILSADRKPNGEFTSEAVAAIAALAAVGVKKKAIADAFGTPRPATISHLIKRFSQRKSPKTKPRPGRPHKLSARQERYLLRTVRKSPCATWRELCLEMDVMLGPRRRSFSINTARRSLRKRKIGHWRAAKRILLTKEDAKERLAFCRYWLSPARLWQLLACLFSDECTVQNEPSTPGHWVFRYGSERYRKDLISPTSHSKPRISLMVWAMVWQREGEAGTSPLIFCKGDPDAPRGGFTAARYIEVLEAALLPFYEPGDPFMQDNARIHRSNAVKEFLESRGIWTIKWPAHSPDLNPIEQVWKALKAKIYEIEPSFQYLKDNMSHQAYAREVVESAWAALDPGLIYRLIGSIPRRLNAVRRARGWYSHY